MSSDKKSLLIDIKCDNNTMNDEKKNFTIAAITAVDRGRGGGERENEKKPPRETSDIQYNCSSHTD